MSRVVVIGGGAAGMMAAIAAAEAGHQVVLLEKNEKLGKKVYLTGKGRCNITNAAEMEDLFAGIIRNAKFLYSSFYRFTNLDMMRLLESCGCPVKTERGGRVFPVSDKSSDVIKALSGRLKAAGVSVRLGTEVGGLKTDGGRITGVLLKKGQELAADAVIVATGGLSYPSTGATGDGYRFAAGLGHTVTELSPALVPFTTGEELLRELQGLSLKNIRARILLNEKVLYEEFGEMLFTHFGVSGPVLLGASSRVAARIKKTPLVLAIDLKPALSPEQLDARILRDFEQEKNKQFKNALTKILPAKLIPVVIDRSRIEPERQINTITREERRRIAGQMKDFRLTLTGLRGYQEAIITQGGVSVKEINPSTMESKKVRHLYFAGEVLDLDGVTGGFNLQIAWSTGYLAGISIE